MEVWRWRRYAAARRGILHQNLPGKAGCPPRNRKGQTTFRFVVWPFRLPDPIHLEGGVVVVEIVVVQTVVIVVVVVVVVGIFIVIHAGQHFRFIGIQANP